MHFLRWGLLAVLLATLGMALYQTLLWFGVGGSVSESQVRPLEGEDQEIALIEPATNTDDWGRLVTALRLLERDWAKINPLLPPLRVSLQDAFPQLTTDVPEIVLSLEDSPRLLLRWYKISGEHDAASWIQKLRQRPHRPPLAVVGGGTSERAVRLAVALRKEFLDRSSDPDPDAPVLAITTATAEKTGRGNLMTRVYPGRSFRFSFSNQRMVESLLQFVQRRSHPKDQDWAQDLWVGKSVDSTSLACSVAGMVGCADCWHSAAVLLSLPHLQPATMYAIPWQDERYSQEMTDLFSDEFKRCYPFSEFAEEPGIGHSVAGFFQPAPQEQVAVGTFLARFTPLLPHSVLVLPTQTVRMRRVLINLRNRSPLDARNLVILNGDAISFASVYRDRDVLWNILDLPYSLVFFAHRNPIDHVAGFTWTHNGPNGPADEFPQRTSTGTDGVLFHRDIFESLLYAAFDQGRLLSDRREVLQRLRQTCWHHPASEAPRVCNPRVHGQAAGNRLLFDSEGNRQSQTGEHIIWVKPYFYEDRVALTSKISVWTIHSGSAPKGMTAWHLVEAFDAMYNQP